MNLDTNNLRGSFKSAESRSVSMCQTIAFNIKRPQIIPIFLTTLRFGLNLKDKTHKRLISRILTPTFQQMIRSAFFFLTTNDLDVRPSEVFAQT